MTLVTRKSRRLRTYLIIIAVMTLVTMAFLYAFHAISKSASVATTSPLTGVKAPVAHKTSTDAAFGLPVRLQIPKLQVDANISYMGLTSDGSMDVPPDLINVGWYKYGTKPGNTGSAVIAGHLEGTEDMGVFSDLSKLRTGDTVSVRNDRNKTISFTVRETKTYKQDERPIEIFNKTDGIYLNLITCSGIWNNSQKRYSHRLVVFTEKVT